MGTRYVDKIRHSHKRAKSGAKVKPGAIPLLKRFGANFRQRVLHGQRRLGDITTHGIYRGKKEQVLSCAFLFCPFLFWEIFAGRITKEVSPILSAVWLILRCGSSAVTHAAAGEEERTET